MRVMCVTPAPLGSSAEALPYATSTVHVGDVVGASVYVDSRLGAQGLTLAQQCLNVVASDVAQLRKLFGSVALPSAQMVISPLSAGHDGTGGAYHASCSSTTLYCDADFQRWQRTSALFVAELSEVYQAAQGRNWNCGATNGEALSRIHAETFYPGFLNDYATGPVWSRQRLNYVDANQNNDTDPVSNGCGVLFLSWLRHLGYTLDKITQKGGATLALTYFALAARPSAWSDFMAAMQQFPDGSFKTDNPWGEGQPSPQPTPPVGGLTLTFPVNVPAGTYTLAPISQLANPSDYSQNREQEEI